eukprot:CAMPEP_0198543304 /NCGR_PEP_ID=MMETSP1462-20131121/59598_1 /TAXON_ID=1333877 /ORGANISM="Brandtodinium nutriculum, Strain RCC3387" /LENGTH=101 /DNA_ID=CAMNT_0044273581 /DNA_START=69 /DNA_END=374 /DNA_ORIENTATION=-
MTEGFACALRPGAADACGTNRMPSALHASRAPSASRGLAAPVRGGGVVRLRDNLDVELFPDLAVRPLDALVALLVEKLPFQRFAAAELGEVRNDGFAIVLS